MRSLVLLALVLAARVASAADTKAPVLEHTPPAKATTGQNVTVSVRITDASEVFLPSLHVRTGAGAWGMKELKKQGDRFVAQLEVTGDLEYWIEAYDEHGNGPGLSGSAARPHRVKAEAPAPRAAKKAAPAPVKVEADTSPPVIVHTPVVEAVAGEDTTIAATVTDPSGVFAPTLYTRVVGAPSFEPQELTPEGDLFVATVSTSEPFEYWLEAYDNQGNGPTRSGTPETPFLVAVRVPVPVAALAPPQVDEGPGFFARVPTKWWVGGAAGAVVAGVAGVVVYSLATREDDDHGRTLVLAQSRR